MCAVSVTAAVEPVSREQALTLRVFLTGHVNFYFFPPPEIKSCSGSFVLSLRNRYPAEKGFFFSKNRARRRWET